MSFHDVLWLKYVELKSLTFAFGILTTLRLEPRPGKRKWLAVHVGIKDSRCEWLIQIDTMLHTPMTCPCQAVNLPLADFDLIVRSKNDLFFRGLRHRGRYHIFGGADLYYQRAQWSRLIPLESQAVNVLLTTRFAILIATTQREKERERERDVHCRMPCFLPSFA